MADVLNADQLNKIATGSGFKGGAFSSVGLPASTTTPPATATPKPSTLAEDQTKATNQGKPGFDALGNAIPGYTAPSTPAPQTDQEKIDAAIQKQNDVNDKLDVSFKQFSDTITGITNGSIPLTPGEQAQVDGLTAQYKTLIDQQKMVNTGAEGTANIRGYQQGAAEYDPKFQSNTINTIISAGVAKIADLTTKMASSVAALTQSLKDNDIANIKMQWDELQQYTKDKNATLQKTVDEAQAHIKAVQDKLDKDKKEFYDQVTKPIQDIALEAAKNGATKDIQAAIKASQTPDEAISVAGVYLQQGTGDMASYLQYKKDAMAKGLTPNDFASWKEAQDAKDLAKKIAEENRQNKADINKIYATADAKSKADANVTVSDKNQQKLEQQYRQVLAKEFSARTGALGVENAKVNQANHLNSLIKQYFDPKTGDYNIPTSQYTELVLGLASLVAPGGSSDASERAEIKSKTAAGDIKGAIQYVTGVPQTGNTQAIIKNLIDSIDRQAETATRNREAALQNMRDQAPTDLEQSRIDKLNKSTEMVKYEGQDRISKANVNTYVKDHPDEAENIAKLYEVPGATDQDIEDYLRAQGKIE